MKRKQTDDEMVATLLAPGPAIIVMHAHGLRAHQAFDRDRRHREVPIGSPSAEVACEMRGARGDSRSRHNRMEYALARAGWTRIAFQMFAPWEATYLPTRRNEATDDT